MLASGWHERLHDALPGIEETRLTAASAPPVLIAPAADAGAEPSAVFVLRDREEELADAVRWIKRRGREAASEDRPRLERTGVVFQRPLPYLYLARQVFGSANVRYQASDALPLAAEPFAAALDLVFAVVAEDASRVALIALLASPHWTFPRRQRSTNRRRGPQSPRSIACCRNCDSWAAGSSWRVSLRR